MSSWIQTEPIAVLCQTQARSILKFILIEPFYLSLEETTNFTSVMKVIKTKIINIPGELLT